MGSVYNQLHQVEAGSSGEQMTRERALELACATLDPHDLDRNIAGDVRRSVADAIFAAVAEEREACARIAESSPNARWHIIAMQIRDRSKPLLSKSRQLLSQNQNSPE